jgi:hypothetical protein
LHDSSEGESEKEDNLQDAYKNLFVQFSKLTRQNKKDFKKLHEIELEKENLLVKLDDSQALKYNLNLALLN